LISRLSHHFDLVTNRRVQTIRGAPIDYSDHQVTTAAEEGDKCAGLPVTERADQPIDLYPTKTDDHL
jgi:hypothetical protein